MARKSGVLLHISSLPGYYGVGDFGYEAEKFALFIKKSGFSVWQVLPLTPAVPIFGNSPYSTVSAFAGSFLFISPDKLCAKGLVSKDELSSRILCSSAAADYEKAAEVRMELLAMAWKRFKSLERFSELRAEYEIFKTKEALWLDDYALFVFFKEKFNGIEWQKWPCDIKERNFSKETLLMIEDERDKLDFTSFIQFIFAEQWKELHLYCASLGIEIIGDMPMFVASDSSDVWAHGELFSLDAQGYPDSVAGVPPDYFSSEGQRWGNPLYLWESKKEELFEWWRARIASSLANFDMIRIDHFRGFCACWSIPADAPTAVCGKWNKVPGRELLEYLQKNLCRNKDKLPFIAEDLGIITDDVRELMDDFSLPGMKVLLFAFGGDVGNNPYAPHNIDERSAVYTGTHDNNTVLGWWRAESRARERMNFRTYVGHSVSDSEAPFAMATLALISRADLAVIPAQDILELGGECRMNTPGTCLGNWKWRMSFEDFYKITGENSVVSSLYMEKNIVCGRFCAD